MYLSRVTIKNIRAISDFEMKFDDFPGWHVLIGDNGSGKSTIIRSIALGLIGETQMMGTKPNWEDWLMRDQAKGSIALEIHSSNGLGRKHKLGFKQTDSRVETFGSKGGGVAETFSAGYGPFRRFTGGSYEKSEVFNNPRFVGLAAHLSLFGEDVALTEATSWLMHLRFQSLESQVANKSITFTGDQLQNLMDFINSPDFLPHGTTLHDISSEGVFFRDGNGAKITINQMSDGYRSILSLTFELLRQLIKRYGGSNVFRNVSQGQMVIDVPGIVLVDEVDAHLHPTWQTRIGNWFTKYFPKIQFIVTTHSPLICRASEGGTIWRLSSPRSDEPSQEIVGIEKEKLVFGDILDAYGTELFGRSPVRSEKTSSEKDRLGKLNILASLGKITDTQDQERMHLQKVFKSDDSNR